LGGAINILGGLTTFSIGLLYARSLEQAARAASLQGLSLHFSQFYTAPLVIPVDRLVATLLVVPVFPIATLFGYQWTGSPRNLSHAQAALDRSIDTTTGLGPDSQ